MYGYIYKTTNILNNKIYIGKKKGDFDKKYLGSGKYLWNAINKNGKDVFTVEVIEFTNSENEQCLREKYWIKYYRDLNVPMYNIADGGEGGDIVSYLTLEDRITRIHKLKKNSHFANLTPEQDKLYRQKAWKSRRDNGNDKQTKEQIQQRSKHLKEFYKTPKGLKLRKETSERNIAKGLATRKQFIDWWYSESRYCKTCGVLLTEIYGSGVYCSKRCSSTHKHSEETKQLIREMNLKGICGNKGRKHSEEHKKRISESHKGLGVGKKFYTNGIKTICVYGEPPEGFKPGRAPRNKPAWNKGLKFNKETRTYERGDVCGKEIKSSK